MSSYRPFVLFIVLQAFLLCRVSSQQSIESYEILMQISGLQVVTDDFYDTGLFPCQRSWLNMMEPVADNNIFITTSIGYILRSIQERVDEKSSKEIGNILRNMNPLYEKYYSRKKKPAYNFWQTTSPDLPFPNGGKLLSRVGYRLPDDYDVTSLIRLADGRAAIADKEIRDEMVSYAKRSDRKPVEKTLDKYKGHLAYEVFYVDKMDQVYDVSAMCNVLLFVFDREYPLNAIDKNTIQFVKQVIQEGDHKKNPEAISPYYRSTVWILYHVSRLLAADRVGAFDDIKSIVIHDLNELLGEELSTMELLVLHNSLLRLGERPKNVHFELNDVEKELKEFVFFQAKFSQMSWLGTMKWSSQALNLTLLYENRVLSK